MPPALSAELARQRSIAERAWEIARPRSDFAALAPELERLIELKRRYVDCFEADHPYDPLLDGFEPGMTTATLRPLIEQLRARTVPLLAAIVSSGVELDDSCLYGDFPAAGQAGLTREIAELMPLDPDVWRLDTTAHPFAMGIAISDLRITTRYEPGFVGTALWALIHEIGHAMYHNGIAVELERTPLAESSSLGFDESQSRLWENWVGRGRPLANHLLPILARHFPERFGGLEPEDLYRAANSVRPSLIRMDADEVTYNLHIALRFELELELFEDRLTVRELPEAWNAKVAEYLGLAVPDDAHGVLQDVHWAGGLFGYFPTYSLGNLIAAQVWDLCRAELPDLDRQLTAGELTPLRDLLRERIYRHGGKFLPERMIEVVVGGPLDAEPLMRQLYAKYGELYGIDAEPDPV